MRATDDDVEPLREVEDHALFGERTSHELEIHRTGQPDLGSNLCRTIDTDHFSPRKLLLDAAHR